MILQHETPKIEIVKIVDGDYKAIEIRQNRDGVDMNDVLTALSKFKDQQFLGDALLNDNVSIWVGHKQYYHLVGNVTSAMYLLHKSSKIPVNLTAKERFNIAEVFKFYDEQIGLDKEQKKAFTKLKLILNQ
jgi:hypothetical protein